MDVIQQRHNPSSSALNPNAPLFVPMAYRTVEDFSDQWWALIQSSPWFREYWLQERYADLENDPFFADNDDSVLLPDIDDLFDDYDITQEEKGREYGKELVSIGGLNWRKGRELADAPKYTAKAPKIVNVKVAPRTIQQPR